jgi:hypothetical protein
MNASRLICKAAAYLAVCLLLTACEKKFKPADGTATQANVTETGNTGLVTVEKPEQFTLVTANRMKAPARLDVTGSVTPDIAREIPAISLASGRMVGGFSPSVVPSPVLR